MYHKTGRIFLGVNFFASKLRAEPEAEGGAMRCLKLRVVLLFESL